MRPGGLEEDRGDNERAFKGIANLIRYFANESEPAGELRNTSRENRGGTSGPSSVFRPMHLRGGLPGFFQSFQLSLWISWA